jgi:hypothetical protein
MIYKKHWVETLISIYTKAKYPPLVTGFNTLTNGHKITDIQPDYFIKESIGGCNLLVNTSFYKLHPFDQQLNWDYIMCENAHSAHDIGVICSRPSVVDHIGVTGHWATDSYHDKAIDF